MDKQLLEQRVKILDLTLHQIMANYNSTLGAKAEVEALLKHLDEEPVALPDVNENCEHVCEEDHAHTHVHTDACEAEATPDAACEAA